MGPTSETPIMRSPELIACTGSRLDQNSNPANFTSQKIAPSLKQIFKKILEYAVLMPIWTIVLLALAITILARIIFGYLANPTKPDHDGEPSEEPKGEKRKARFQELPVPIRPEGHMGPALQILPGSGENVKIGGRKRCRSPAPNKMRKAQPKRYKLALNKEMNEDSS